MDTLFIPKGFVKDKRTNLVINNNVDEMRTVLGSREKAKEIKALRKDLDMLRREVDKLKQMVLDGAAINRS